MDEADSALETKKASKKALAKVHERALKRFDEAVLPQLEQRALSLAARRFVSIPGAQWEGDWGDPFDNAIKVEINKTGRGLRKIVNDYRQNRIVPDFRPAGGRGDQDTANTLDGIHRADDYRFKAQQARDNAFEEAAAGGMGAWRLANELDDPYDKDSDAQRINPGLLIADADQTVFFDPQSRHYDKSDARFAFVITNWTKDAFEGHYEGGLSSWPAPASLSYRSTYDWFMPEAVRTCEYWEVEEVEEKLFVLTHPASGEEQRHFESEIEEDALEELLAKGWVQSEKKRTRRRVHKYVLSGAEVLKDQGRIAGCHIPIVPVYGKRWFIDNVERFEGHVQTKMDAQRQYNAANSRLAEVSAQSPRDIPIFAASQMPPALAENWKNQVVDRHAYAIVEPLVDPATGSIVSPGPIGMLSAAQVPQATAALLQIANQDLTEDDADQSEQVKSNVSEEAMNVAAARIDAKSGLYLDNMRQSVQREGEIYLDMTPDVYFEVGREVETMTEDGDDGVAVLAESVTDDKGKNFTRNVFASGKYKVIASVTEATATRRDKAIKSALNTAQMANEVGDTELAQAALITAVMNQDGEGMADLQALARRRGLAIGLVQPNDEEKAAQEEAAENAQPDPSVALMEAQSAALAAGAEKDQAMAGKYVADTGLSEAKTVETLIKAGQPVPPPEPLPMPTNDVQPIIRPGSAFQ